MRTLPEIGFLGAPRRASDSFQKYDFLPRDGQADSRLVLPRRGGLHMTEGSARGNTNMLETRWKRAKNDVKTL